MQAQTPSEAPPETRPVEGRGDRLRRHGHRVRLYATALAVVALLVLLIALAAANTRNVALNWLIGEGHASLVWIIVVATLLGWLLGIATSVLFRFRTRRRR